MRDNYAVLSMKQFYQYFIELCPCVSNLLQNKLLKKMLSADIRFFQVEVVEQSIRSYF